MPCAPSSTGLRGQELTIAAACCVCLRIRRPMVFYFGIEMLFAIKHVMLLGTGFSSYRHRGYTFYTYGMQLGERQRVHPSSTAAAPDAQVPILFLHGVGIGLLPYAPFVFRLAAAGQPLLAIESSHLGMRWVSHCPSEDEVAEAIDEILDQCKVTTAAVVSGKCKPSLANASHGIKAEPEAGVAVVLRLCRWVTATAPSWHHVCCSASLSASSRWCSLTRCALLCSVVSCICCQFKSLSMLW